SSCDEIETHSTAWRCIITLTSPRSTIEKNTSLTVRRVLSVDSSRGETLSKDVSMRSQPSSAALRSLVGTASGSSEGMPDLATRLVRHRPDNYCLLYRRGMYRLPACPRNLTSGASGAFPH